MPGRLSLSKDKIKVLLVEGISQAAADLFAERGYTNVERLPKALDPTQLGRRSRASISSASARGRN